MWSDIRFAVRRLAAAKGFTITGTLILALGIGASTGIFTLVHAVMIKSLPVADPQRIVRIGDGDNCCVLGGFQDRYSVYSYALYSYLREHTPEFEDISAFQAGSDKVGVRREGANTSDPFVDQFVSGNYFTVFGIRPFAGRLIQATDDARGAAPVAVMSYRVWQQRYASDPSVLGATFHIDGTPYTIAGIAPPGFFGATLRPDPPDFWMPLAMEPVTYGRNSLLDQKNSHWLYLFGRIKPGTALAPVEAELTTELRQWLLDNEAVNNDRDRQNVAKMHITLTPGGAGVAALKENYQRDLRLLLGITALVLLIACANLANLQLARGASAAAQTSIRVALGAPRSVLIRQVLVESIILAVLGGALGLLVAMQTADLLIRLAFHGATFVPIDTTPALPVLGFAFLLSLVTGLVFGIAPAWSASRADPAAALRAAGRSIGGRSTASQKTLVVLQAALSLVLLAGAGLMVQTLRNLSGQQFGFRMEGSLVVNVNAAVSGYSPEKLASIYGEIDRQMRLIPGVRNAAMVLYSPMSGDNWQMNATLEERPQQRTSPSWDRVSPSFFDTVGARILRGRGFDERDTPSATHVAVVNQAFADAYFPNEEPIGKRFGLGGFAHRGDYAIVGVVNTIRFRNPRGPGRPMFFVPLLQMWPSEWNETSKASSNLIHSIILRVDHAPPDLTSRIQRTLGAIDPKLTLLNVVSTSEMLGGLLAHEQTIGVLAQVFGLLALILASVGLYGLTAYSVARRTNEIGVRTALGATRAHVVRLILRDALAQTCMGLAVGIPAALAAGRMLADQVYGVKTWDPLILGTAALTLGICAAIAGVIPAMRASSVDPVTALRVDN
ncbi:MAG TPA: ABC transporter permease [Bryobacteraceae bacterium]|nr:ABC transporter permease [Bryobacteraceae bacterium]